jgi:hypothetical protein
MPQPASVGMRTNVAPSQRQVRFTPRSWQASRCPGGPSAYNRRHGVPGGSLRPLGRVEGF